MEHGVDRTETAQGEGQNESARSGVSPSPEYSDYARGSEDLQKEFEGRLFWFGGGVVALALGGAQAIRAVRALHVTGLLVWGVGVVFTGLFLALLGFRISAIAYVKFAEYFHDGSPEDKYLDAQRVQKAAGFLDWSSFVCVMAGSALVAAFYLSNLRQ
jgi:hypothetical protein